MSSSRDRVEESDQDDEPESIVSAGVENAMRAGLSYSMFHPSVLLKMWIFQRVMTGRIVFKLTSAGMDKLLSELSTNETQSSGLSNLDLAIVQSRLLKHALSTHPLQSKLYASLVTGPELDKSSHLSLNFSHIKKSIRKVCLYDTKLTETIAANHQLFNEKLETSKNYSEFIESSTSEIAKMKEIKAEQVDDEDSRRLIRKEKNDCLFFAELCSRLMPHIILDSTELIEAYRVTSKAFFELNE